MASLVAATEPVRRSLTDAKISCAMPESPQPAIFVLPLLAGWKGRGQFRYKAVQIVVISNLDPWQRERVPSKFA